MVQKLPFGPLVNSTLMNGGMPGKYILYADDDADDQDMIRELLLQIFPEVQLVVKDNGEDLLRFVSELQDEANMPALIILDLNMPGFDGIQTLSLIKQSERHKHLPVLIFSTAVNEADKNRAFSAGAIAFVGKPSSYAELRVIIESFSTYLKP